MVETAINSVVYNMDCMEGMKSYPDKYFDLAVVDPPYGIGVNHNMGRRTGVKPSDYKVAYWDYSSPNEEYFDEITRVSINQIVWGANHFIEKLSKNSSCWLIWDKKFSDAITFSQCELAWTSFNSTVKKFEMFPNNSDLRIHPTQKPVALYDWIFKNYAKPTDKILDTHLGSGSSRIAAYKAKLDFTGFELDKDYYDAAENRFQEFIKQERLF